MTNSKAFGQAAISVLAFSGTTLAVMDNAAAHEQDNTEGRSYEIRRSDSQTTHKMRGDFKPMRKVGEGYHKASTLSKKIKIHKSKITHKVGKAHIGGKQVHFDKFGHRVRFVQAGHPQPHMGGGHGHFGHGHVAHSGSSSTEVSGGGAQKSKIDFKGLAISAAGIVLPGILEDNQIRAATKFRNSSGYKVKGGHYNRGSMKYKIMKYREAYLNADNGYGKDTGPVEIDKIDYGLSTLGRTEYAMWSSFSDLSTGISTVGQVIYSQQDPARTILGNPNMIVDPRWYWEFKTDVGHNVLVIDESDKRVQMTLSDLVYPGAGDYNNHAVGEFYDAKHPTDYLGGDADHGQHLVKRMSNPAERCALLSEALQTDSPACHPRARHVAGQRPSHVRVSFFKPVKKDFGGY